MAPTNEISHAVNDAQMRCGIFRGEPLAFAESYTLEVRVKVTRMVIFHSGGGCVSLLSSTTRRMMTTCWKHMTRKKGDESIVTRRVHSEP